MMSLAYHEPNSKLAQWVRVFVTLAEDPYLILSTVKAFHNCLWLQFQGISYPFLTTAGTIYMWYTYMHVGKILVYIT